MPLDTTGEAPWITADDIRRAMETLGAEPWERQIVGTLYGQPFTTPNNGQIWAIVGALLDLIGHDVKISQSVVDSYRGKATMLRQEDVYTLHLAPPPSEGAASRRRLRRF